MFLDTLPPASADEVLGALTRVRLDPGVVLAEADAVAEHVYFPVDSLIGTIARMADGTVVEVGGTGCEGMAPVTPLFGSRTSPHATVVQFAGFAYCGSAARIAAVADRDRVVRRRLRAWIEYALVSTAQFSACNNVHSIEQRYARWLLGAVDRVGEDLELTQEASAQMLGVRRPGISIVAGALATAGIIWYRRGRVSVLNRERLHAAACECYGVVDEQLRRLMGYAVPRVTP